jgi:[histone H3]-lysine9 N-trimethyltransferase EHMT
MYSSLQHWDTFYNYYFYVFKFHFYRLVEPKAVVFECGANCSCNHDCVNRTSQQGLQYRLEVGIPLSKSVEV